jgi:hypothetical protein
MYRIKRTDTNVAVLKGSTPVFSAHPDSYVVYEEGDERKDSRIGELTDEQLLLALANRVPIQSKRLV